MSESKFTPGPWHIREHHTFPQFDVYADQNQFGDEDSFNHVATVLIDEFHDPFDGEENSKYFPTLRDNANLIAAAPKMYGALEKARKAIQKNLARYAVKDEQALLEAFNEIEAAMKKARGEE